MTPTTAQIRKVALEVLDAEFTAANPDWWPDYERWADDIAYRLEQEAAA